jgi:hypothetical protein
MTRLVPVKDMRCCVAHTAAYYAGFFQVDDFHTTPIQSHASIVAGDGTAEVR